MTHYPFTVNFSDILGLFSKSVLKLFSKQALAYLNRSWKIIPRQTFAENQEL